MNYLQLEGTHYAIGQQLGAYFGSTTRFPIRLNAPQQQHGTKSLQFLEAQFPEVAEEIAGVASCIDTPYEQLGAWLMCMGSCLTTREKHNVEVRGCTAFCFVAGDKVLYGRDNDLPPYLKEVSKSITYRIPGKHAFLLNTSSFINGEEGMNQHGFVAAMTFVIPRKEQIVPGINSLFLVRYLLENCTTVPEGIEALRTLSIATSCNILLADKTGAMCVVECSPYEVRIRQPVINTRQEAYIVTVNHFTSPAMQVYDRSRQNVYASQARYATADNALKKAAYADPLLYAQDILRGKFGFMCQYKNVKFETVWSTVFDVSDLRMHLAAGNPAVTDYAETALFTA